MPTRFALGPMLDAVTSTLFPGACALCRAETDGPAALCPDCWREVAFIGPGGCRKCGRPLPGPAEDGPGAICEDCLMHPRHWDRGASVFRYEGRTASWCWPTNMPIGWTWCRCWPPGRRGPGVH